MFRPRLLYYLAIQLFSCKYVTIKLSMSLSFEFVVKVLGVVHVI